MTIKITSATFSACITSSSGLPADELPIIALVGRSNVGKSSLINAITGRKELARTSSLPGKTLTINFYCINEAFYIVDLPGYGYAKASKVTRARIQAMMNEFFAECKNLKAVVQVLDIRHKPSPLDVQMHDWIRDQKFNHFAVLTKADKLSNQQAMKMRTSITRDIKGAYSIFFSAKTFNGKDDFLDAIEKVIAGLEFKSNEGRQKKHPRSDERQNDRQKNRPPRPQRQERPAQEKGQGSQRVEKADAGETTEKTDAAPVKSPDTTPENQQPANRPAPRRPQSQPQQRQNQSGNQGNQAGSNTGGNNNRRRRWKNRKPGSEPRQEPPKND
ncbi:MAG TPA: ribosome biogenesis GTP-binding protein YihA/YsxC [Candidatus Ozemobacteraceae bacterium]|nr:ribosome biogenesis GTP-binding protein YihA/YsxC [Candidatus Ozemobacteraceae bacterium]